MTWSVIAKDDKSGRIGIIAATRFFAVGSLLPHIRTGVGAVATQAFINPEYGPAGLDLIAAGRSATDAIAELTRSDEGRNHRQIHVLDASGRFAAFTGSACVEHAGHLIGETFSVAGNMLAGPRVLSATAEAYLSNVTVPFARRLILAMQAGEAAGGDKRGKQSAALLIHDAERYPLYDLRVDDHPDPLTELARLQHVARERFIHFRRRMPSSTSASGMTDRSDLEPFIARSIAEGYE